MANLKTKYLKENEVLKKDWRFYSKSLLSSKLAMIDLNCKEEKVQDCWNDLENKIIIIVDEIVPLKVHCSNVITTAPCPFVKHKLNLKNILLKNFHRRATQDLKLRI